MDVFMKGIACISPLFLFWALISPIEGPLHGEEARPMGLGECQALALQQSERLSIAELEILIEKEKIREIQGANVPKLSAEAQVARRDKHPGSNAPSDITFPSREENRPRREKEGGKRNTKEKKTTTNPKEFPERIKTITGRKTENTAKVSLVVPIFDSGVVSNKVVSQRYLVEASQQDRARIVQILLNEVSQSYFSFLEAKKLEGVVLQSIETLKKQKETSEDLFSVGFITKHDLLIVDVQLYERQQELIQVKNNQEIAKASLNRLMGNDLQTPLALAEVSEEAVWDDNYRILTAKSDICHPDLKKREAQKNALPFEYDSIRAEILPKLDGFIDYNASSDRFLLHRHWIVGGLQLRVPLFDGGITSSRLQQKKDEMSASDLLLKKEQEDIHLDIKRAYVKVDAAFHKIPVALKSVQESEENLRMSSDLYKEGLLSCDDLLNDESRLAQAKANYYQSLYQWHMAKAELLFAAGLIRPEEPVVREAP